MSDYAWVTLSTNDTYSLGALVLAHSLRQVETNYQLVCMITPGLSHSMREKLSATFDVLFEVNILDSQDEANLLLLQRPELGITFTKLHCWRLTQYKKCVFLDADTLVLQNCDELFEREEFSASADVGWPDCFNSGVFVYKPSIDTYRCIVKFALENGSFDGGDQGLLNLYFSSWAHRDISKHLPFIYNMCSTACYSYLPAFKQFGDSVKIVHFIGTAKPWLQFFDSENLQVKVSPGFEHLQQIFQHWWDIFCAHVHSKLSSNMCGLAGTLSQMTLGQSCSVKQDALEDHLRRQGWEVGNIDYLGRDCFDNIWKKICETLHSPNTAQSPQALSSLTENTRSSAITVNKKEPNITKEETKTPDAEMAVVQKPNLSLVAKSDMSVVAKPDMSVVVKSDNLIAAKSKMPVVANPDMLVISKPETLVVEKCSTKLDIKPKPEEFNLAYPSVPEKSSTSIATKSSPLEKPSRLVGVPVMSETEKLPVMKLPSEKATKKATSSAIKKIPASVPASEKSTSKSEAMKTAKTVTKASLPETSPIATSAENEQPCAPSSKKGANVGQERKKTIKKK